MKKCEKIVKSVNQSQFKPDPEQLGPSLVIALLISSDELNIPGYS